jgi:hypothetical protein
MEERAGRVESYGSSALTYALIHRTSQKGSSANFAMTEFSEVARRASGSGIMVVVERVKASYATPGLEKGEDDA